MRTRSRFYHRIAVAAAATDTVGGVASAMVWKTTLPPCPVFEYVLSFEIVFLPFKYFMVFHCCFVNQRKASILTILFSLHRYHRAAYGTRVWLSTLFFLTHVIHSCNQSVSQSFIYGMSYRTEVCSHLTRMFSRCYLSTFWYGCHLVNTFLFSE